jgi:SAM-dependent methyltransferase
MNKRALKGKKIVDVACGGRMFWFNKKHPATLFLDQRTMPPTKMSNGATLEVKPDMLMDFRKLDLPSDHFSLVVFDPPHVLNAGDKSFLAKKYGYLKPDTWRADLAAGFSECFRVLKPDGVLVFKWCEMHIPVKDILALTPELPLFGNRSGKASKTHWVVFMKS